MSLKSICQKYDFRLIWPWSDLDMTLDCTLRKDNPNPCQPLYPVYFYLLIDVVIYFVFQYMPTHLKPEKIESNSLEDTIAMFKEVKFPLTYWCNVYIVPLELEGAELPLYKMAVLHLLTPRKWWLHFTHSQIYHVLINLVVRYVCPFTNLVKIGKQFVTI